MTLSKKISKIIEASGANIGCAIRHLESGQEVMINADQYYPLASVFKVPILVEASFRMAEGKLKPETRWELKDEVKNLPSGLLVFLDQGLKPTVKDLLTLMIIISDNTATDMLLNKFTKKAVVDRMRSLGLDKIHIPMTVRELFQEIIPNPDPTLGYEDLEAQEKELRIDRRTNRIYKLSPVNNVGTPRQMVDLMQMIYDGKTPNRQWSDFALEILKLQQINERIPRFLPSSARVAHKTGTIMGVRNDCGIIYAGPNSHIAIGLFTLWNEKQGGSIEKARAGVQKIEDTMGLIALEAFKQFAK